MGAETGTDEADALREWLEKVEREPRGDSQTSHLTIEGWFRKVHDGQAMRASLVGVAARGGELLADVAEERPDEATNDGVPDLLEVLPPAFVTPHSPHLLPLDAKFLKPQIWHAQVCADGWRLSSSYSASCASPPFSLSDRASSPLLYVLLLLASGARESVILGELLKKPTQYSVCLTRCRSRYREFLCGWASSR